MTKNAITTDAAPAAAPGSGSTTPRVAATPTHLTAPSTVIDLATLPNVLERDGIAVLLEQFLSPPSADELLRELMGQVAWEQHTTTKFGKTSLVPRQVAWFGSASYDYSGIHHDAAPWPTVLVPLRDRLSAALGVDFNTVLLNQYPDGKAKVGWHADDEPIFGVDPTIASISLGGSRRFLMRHRDRGPSQKVELHHGSLLVMAGAMQRRWVHSVPPTTRPVPRRLNLPFRHAVS